jgi:hypothetical protein
MSEQFLFDRLVILNSIYNNSIQPFRYNEQQVSIKTQLMHHQHLLVNAMHKYKERMLRGVLYENKTLNGKIGILGDREGTGKTLSVLAYIASDDPVPPSITCELSDNSSKYFFSCELHQNLPQSIITNLIIIPPPLFQQWKNEISTHTALKYVAFDTKRSIKGDNLLNTIRDSSFILTTSKCYRHVQQYANDNNIKWNNIFIDEASTIYLNSSDPKLNFQFLWLISSNWIPLIFKHTFMVKSDLYHLKERIQMHPDLDVWLSNTVSNQYTQTLESSSFFKDYLPFYHSLRGFLVLRNSNDALNKIHIPQEIVKNITCHQTFSLYSLISYYKFKNVHITSANIPKLFRALSVEYLDMEEYLERNDTTKHKLITCKMEENECVICFEKTEHPTIVNCCHNIYCAKCLLTHMLVSQKCPTCRESLSPESICCFSTEEEMTLNTKAEELINIIKNNQNAKFIVYTTFNCIYYHIYNDLDKLGIRAERIENNIYSINKTIKNYMDGTTQVLFVSDMDMNTMKGLSLKNTTHLVFYHELSSYEQQQVLIRSSMRIGKQTPLEIIHLNSDIEL